MSVGEIEIDLDALRSKQRGKARFAQRFVYLMGPADAPRIPLSNFEHDNLLVGGIKQITAWYGRSLALFNYQVFDHPDFEAFGSGVMASPLTREAKEGAERQLADYFLRVRSTWPLFSCSFNPPRRVSRGRRQQKKIKAPHCAERQSCRTPVAVR